ncbi:MAG: CHAT domain-containing protein, partial [Pseudanabaena sp.]
LFLKQSVNISEEIRKDIKGLSKEEQKSYLSTVEKHYRYLADLLLKQDRILEAQQVLDLLKVQELSDYLKTVRGNSQTSQGVDLQLPEQNIIALAGELNQLQQKDREGKLNEVEQQRLAQLAQSERDQNKQFNAFLGSDQIKKLIAELRRKEDNQNVDIAKYRKLQKDLLSQFPKAVLLYPLILEDRLELVLLNANTPPLRRTVKINREDLNQLIGQTRADIQDVYSEDIKISAQKLYNILIKPFDSELNQLKIDTIIYAPDGQLRYLPLAALYDGKQWLIEKYRVNNITAESLTAFNRKNITNPRIFAGAFGGKARETRAGFSGLPASIPEVQKISSLFPNTTTLIEKEFTKQITTDRANSHTILHLATHGQLLIGSPEDSFILCGNNDKVTVGELKDWNLKNVDIVVLSACQSGLGGKLGSGIEILGLGYQMQSAGARVAIASLWEVYDAGTQALMSAFYQELKRGDLSAIAALQRAQISLIKSPKYNHPNYWSAFFVIGNGL